MSVADRRPPRPGRTQHLLYVATAGWGKTSALEAAHGGAPPLGAREVLAAPGLLDRRSIVAVDELDRLDAPAQTRLLGLLGGLPAGVAVRLAGRSRPAAEAREAWSAPFIERTAWDLALDDAAIARVLRDEHGIENGAAPRIVRRLTAGWPALVHLAAEALTGDLPGARSDHPGAAADAASGASSAALAEALTAPGTPGHWWIETHVLSDLTNDAIDVLEATARLDVVTPELCAAVLGDSPRWARVCRDLATLGLLTRAAWPWDNGYQVVPALAGVVAGHDPVSVAYRRHAQEPSARTTTAARWYGENGMALPQVRALCAAGADDEARAVVLARSDEVLGVGGAADAVRLLSPDREPGARSRLVLGDAHRITGDAPAALRALAPLAVGPTPSGTGWRLAGVHYMRGEYDAALRVLDDVDRYVETASDEVRTLAMRAHALAVLGRVDEADEAADEAIHSAELAGDPRAVAAAHLSAAMSATGPRRDSHHDRAVRAAEAAGDAVQCARALANRSSSLLAAASYTEARDTARRAVEVADTGCPPGLLTVALHNLAEAERRTGGFEEAAVVLRRAVALCSTVGSSRAAFAHLGLAEVDEARGLPDRAAMQYRDAVEGARANGEVQVLVQALSGLARLLCWDEGTRDEARAAALEAEQVTTEEFRPFAALASGWVALASGAPDEAADAAGRASVAARDLGWLDLRAEALELEAAVATDPGLARTALTEALTLWADGGAGPAADRVRVLLGRIPDAGSDARLAGSEAARRLQRTGLRHVHGQPLTDSADAAEVWVRLHGPFQVSVRGRRVPVQAWRSRQARTLVKVLAARAGRPVTRGELCDLLWPDDDPTKTGHRLSVLLSAVRSVLDPDRRWPVDRFVTADLDGLALDLRHVRVDLDQLQRDEAEAQRLLAAGDLALAERLLVEVVSSYPGPALDDEPYAEWAGSVREESRATLHRCLWNLAEVHRRSGNDSQVVGLLVRLLGEDPYDEHAHRGLVRALVRRGRHGEARRAFTRWAEAMREIAAPPPDARMLTPASVPRPRGAAVLTS